MERGWEKYFHCCMPGCDSGTEEEGITLFRLPKEPARLHKWLSASDSLEAAVSNSSARVCSKHFLPSDIIKKSRRTILRKAAIPLRSIFLDIVKATDDTTGRDGTSMRWRSVPGNPHRRLLHIRRIQPATTEPSRSARLLQKKSGIAMAASCLAASEVFNRQNEIIAPMATVAPATEPCLDASIGSDFDAGDVDNKQYHELEPPSKSAANEPNGEDQALSRTCLVAAPVSIANCKPRMTRRSRRLVKDEHVPLKKRRRIMTSHLEDNENDYILPTHVQLQEEKETAVRRLRSKRPATASTDPAEESTSDSEAVLNSGSKEIKVEPDWPSEELPESSPLVIVSVPPKRKRGRPRKNEMPQRLLVTPAAQPPAPLQPNSPPVPVRPGPGRPRKVRKSAAPARIQPAPPSPEPSSPLKSDQAERIDTDAASSAPFSPQLTVSRPASLLLTLRCSTLPAAAPVSLSDRQPEECLSEKGWSRRGRRRGGGDRDGGRQLQCATCGKIMLSIARLKKHQLVHTEERPFHCDKCPKSFKSVHVLNAHQLTHINYRPFRCDICHQTFAKKWTLRGHMSTHERQEGCNELVCRDCGCEFQDRSTYESHIKIHTGEREWECKVCHRSFAKKLKLQKHMVVHSETKLHKCHLCPREFRWKEKLVKHVMLHTGERPFKCTEPRCVKSFRALSDLNFHIRNVHKKEPKKQPKKQLKKLDYPIVKSEPKPNHCELLLMRVNEMDGIPPCDLCTKHFASKDEYLNHIIPAHRDQEAYVCHPCKRVFDNKRIYDDHIEERHRRGEIMWRCQLCPKIFNKRSLFEGHKTLHASKFQCKICFRFASDERRLQVHIMNHRNTEERS